MALALTTATILCSGLWAPFAAADTPAKTDAPAASDAPAADDVPGVTEAPSANASVTETKADTGTGTSTQTPAATPATDSVTPTDGPSAAAPVSRDAAAQPSGETCSEGGADCVATAQAFTAAQATALPPRNARSLDRVPRYIVYYDARVSTLESVVQSDFSHVYLAFATVPAEGGSAPLTLSDPPNLAGQWDAVSDLQAAGKLVLLSLGGGDMGSDAWARIAGRERELATLVADVVTKRGLDGVGIDFEISDAFKGGSEQPFDGRKMLVALTRALKQALPDGSLISHAPESAYLSRSWHDGPYLDILEDVGPQIDWIQIQYYNNPAFDTPIDTNLLGRIETAMDSSVAGLVAGAGGVTFPAHKIAVGKPIYDADASTGHLPPDQVRSKILEPLIADYPDGFGGLMGWQYADDTDDHDYWNSQMAPGTPLADPQPIRP